MRRMRREQVPGGFGTRNGGERMVALWPPPPPPSASVAKDLWQPRLRGRDRGGVGATSAPADGPSVRPAADAELFRFPSSVCVYVSRQQMQME